ncbi:uncharacterized protein BDZ99DRAFT_489297 [Mytilinidion resinicola]|uniref:AB hydrolase-1 domain-containing protein n=1 Tax=Mytilinidion resinicola TaxID=574789 RepID=A0A6A6YFP9_9PEZI|nr:uncharacterized protein BDZ99DRAFT_489297 [Mytilinidion resinicola]KAF2807646.1 hypothetical protein BDZ99DRAFT_489297 [Mytilinidion resinicola]
MAAPEVLGLSKPFVDPADAKVDIVFVHGLNGGRESTWTHEPSHVFWPKDLLPKACPEARILAFGYSSGWVRFFGSVGTQGISQTTIGDHSAALLGDLAKLRDRTESNEQPLIFVAHSLGGLVVANALSSPHGDNIGAQSVVKATRGVLFFGTPFEGSNKARWGGIVETFLKVFTETNPKNIETLKEHSDSLVAINHNFAKFLMSRAKSQKEHSVEVANFFEELSLKIGRKSVGRIVTQDSATIVGVDPIGIEADHISMCKFEDEERRGYVRASEQLQGWIKRLPPEPKQEKRKLIAKSFRYFKGTSLTVKSTTTVAL